MQRAMVGFHQDVEGHWVAELSCGHTQHVRHAPPFQLRPWVVTEQGRAGRIGQHLECPACDLRELPKGHAAYRRTPSFTSATTPGALLARHATKAGVWGVLKVERGALEFIEREGESERRTRLSAGESAVIRPEVEHRVAPLEDAEFFIELWRAASSG